MTTLYACVFSVIILLCSGGTNHTRDLCTPWRQEDVDFQLNFSVLPSTAKAFVCDGRRPSNYVWVEGFFTQKELQSLVDFQKRWKRKPTYPNVPQWVEQRIAAFFGVGTTTDKTYRKSQHDFEESDDGDGMHLDENIHTDRLNAPDRFATMLAYIRAPKSGGHTLFPYIGSVPEWGQSHQAKELQESLTMFPEPWENRDHDGLVVEAGGLDVYDSSMLPKIHRQMDSMCTAVRLASEQDSKYPYFAAVPEPGSAIFWWHWRRLLPEDSSQSWMDVVPDWHPAAWHRRCPCKGERLVLRSLIHSQALNCDFDSSRHPVPSHGAQRPPRRGDCKGFLKDSTYGCGKFECREEGGHVKITYSKKPKHAEL